MVLAKDRVEPFDGQNYVEAARTREMRQLVDTCGGQKSVEAGRRT